MATVLASSPYSSIYPQSLVVPRDSILVPACDRNEAIQTLSALGGGSLLGAGKTFRADIEAIRNEYERQVGLLAAEVAEKRARGISDAQIRPWAIAERVRIMRAMRLRQGRVARLILEGRDVRQYGWGGRSESNLVNRALDSKKFQQSGLTLDDYLIRGSMNPNAGITESAVRAGKYLKYGGKILVPLGIAGSVYAVATARPGDRLKVAGEEATSWAGGALASEAAVALMILAPETGGLTLLGVALIAGGVGGGLSGWGFHKLFFTNHPQAQHVVQSTGTLPASMVHSVMPPPPVIHSGSR